MTTLTLKEKAFGNYECGRFAGLLEDPIKFKKPFEARDNLNLWEFDEKLIDESLNW